MLCVQVVHAQWGDPGQLRALPLERFAPRERASARLYSQA